MIFRTDRQTTADLAIIGSKREDSVYGIFNRTVTAGGAGILEEMFLSPFADAESIAERSAAIAFFAEESIDFPFDGVLMDTLEYYLSDCDSRSLLTPEGDNLERKFKSALGTNTQYDSIKKGVKSVFLLLQHVSEFVQELISHDFKNRCGFFPDILKSVIVENPSKLNYENLSKLDREFRFSKREVFLKIMQEIYKFDVLISVAKVSVLKGYTRALPVTEGDNLLNICDGFHPLLEKAVPNSLMIDKNSNMIFLTGANMAGKSTFMKMVGISLYLAHMGFPVPAVKMEFRVLKGMFTTINLADDINQGLSHFYAEVVRVKRVAESVGKEGNMMVIFDELFRGTNVKDAYDATVAVADAFAGIKNSLFVISSHIIEAGKALKERRRNIAFLNLPTIMDGNIPGYTYKVTEGITNDRHGMLIIKNEGIPEILERE